MSIPKFGVGSSRCAGNENLIDARSETPINLLKSRSLARSNYGLPDAVNDIANLLNIPRNVFNLDELSGSGSPRGIESGMTASSIFVTASDV
jgi:hypothetical protein